MKSLLVLTIALAVTARQPEASQDVDYEDAGGRTLGSSAGGTLVSPQHELKGFEPIYVSPELEDILDRQAFNVYHEHVHGTILMPRLSFALNDDDQPLKDDPEEFNLVPGVDPKFYGRRRGGGGRGGGGGCGPGCMPFGSGGRAPIPMFPNPLSDPTIEEMIPYARIRDTPDTYIVMADDPVLAVDSVPKCSKNANKADASTPAEGEDGVVEPESTPAAEGESAAPEGGESTEAAEGGESTAAAEGGEESTTEASERRRRKRRSLLFE